MYEIIKTVILSKNYDLVGLLNKIDSVWIQGNLSDEQRMELIELAREKADSGNSIDVIKKLTSMEQEINVLKERIAALENPAVDPEVPEENISEYEAGKWYYKGDKVLFGGKKYECIAPEGVVCVWSPADYPVYWQELGEVTEPEVAE